MAPLKRLSVAVVVGVVGCFGCSANRSQMTTQIVRPLQATDALGKVVVVSAVSAEKSKPWHAKQAAEVRQSLQQWLEKNFAAEVVDSHELLPLHESDRGNDDPSAIVQHACAGVRGQPVDTVCLVQLKNAGGDVTIGLGIPAELVSVRGKCDYDLRLIDVRTGRERFCATGSWSEQTGSPSLPTLPSASRFGEQLARAVQPASTSTTSPR